MSGLAHARRYANIGFVTDHQTHESRIIMASSPQIENVTAVAKANVYFDGKVVSHTLIAADGARTTLGLIFPGSYHFNTEAAEHMQIVDGVCRVKLAGETDWTTYPTGSEFDVPANSSFDIAVDEGIGQYICSFL